MFYLKYPVVLSAIPFYVMANVFPRYIRWNISSIFYGICIHLLLCGFHIILYRIEGFIRDNGPYHILYPLNLRSALHQMKHLMCMELFDACACVCVCVSYTPHLSTYHIGRYMLQEMLKRYKRKHKRIVGHKYVKNEGEPHKHTLCIHM